MPKYKITWSCFPTPVYAEREIEAETLEEACAYAEETTPEPDEFYFNADNVDDRDISVLSVRAA
jgi:hypothetical protein